jgi:prepilin-type N-terminal cleavage/methylation domain-containing protein
MINPYQKRAFSLIEVVFVLVILGIVASISSQIIVQVYENYITQNAIYKVSTKTELVANQIVNRLAYRIQGTTISKAHSKFLANKGTLNWATEGVDWLKLEDIPAAGTTFTTIEWIGFDNDGFAANANPSWSGVANYESATIDRFVTPGSSLANASTILSNLSDKKVDLTQKNPAAVIFSQKNGYYTASNPYSPICMGLIPQDSTSSTQCIYPVWSDSNTSLSFVRTGEAKYITERYKLAWSAYALAPEPNANGLFDLKLYANYQPWNGENYIDDGTPHTLMTNVSVFKFTENGGVIQIKLCATELLGDYNVSTCKEKVVIR